MYKENVVLRVVFEVGSPAAMLWQKWSAANGLAQADAISLEHNRMAFEVPLPPVQKEALAAYFNVHYLDLEAAEDEFLGELAAQRMREAEMCGEQPIPWDEVKARLNL